MHEAVPYNGLLISARCTCDWLPAKHHLLLLREELCTHSCWPDLAEQSQHTSVKSQ